MNCVVIFKKHIYFLGVFDIKEKHVDKIPESEEDDIDDLITKKLTREQEKILLDKDNMDLIESSLMFPWNTTTKDWTVEEVKLVFVIS